MGVKHELFQLQTNKSLSNSKAGNNNGLSCNYVNPASSRFISLYQTSRLTSFTTKIPSLKKFYSSGQKNTMEMRKGLFSRILHLPPKRKLLNFGAKKNLPCFISYGEWPPYSPNLNPLGSQFGVFWRAKSVLLLIKI